MKNVFWTLLSLAATWLLILSYMHPSQELSCFRAITVSMLIIAGVLVAICYALQPIKQSTAVKIIDRGYWGSFVVVVACVLYSATTATASTPNDVQPPPATTQSAPTFTPKLPSSTECQPDWVCKGLNINVK